MSNDFLSLAVTGIDELLADLAAKGEKTMTALEGTLYRQAEKVMTKSKRLCPVNKGPLRASGHVDQPVRSGNEVTVNMGYGNSSVDYAEIVHERLDVNHKPPTQAKFLEQPALEAIPEIEKAVAEALKAAWG